MPHMQENIFTNSFSIMIQYYVLVPCEQEKSEPKLNLIFSVLVTFFLMVLMSKLEYTHMVNVLNEYINALKHAPLTLHAEANMK